ncbi:acyltransferase family protein [Mucilaginibacter sp. HMF5004]|uniref:acyltransferase n=1 Tax=Mucilaginibacter rivuli TaxID=2857527 RepID=UPI001C5E209C|nr:acyltransferase family protein [Mucilaginibacter rivuli]MBW4890645.1 acyltransferase family protein [Mucilaginibacter rivuli]
MPASKPQQLDWINNLRVIALFAVVMLHTTSPVMEQFHKGPLSLWLVGDLYNSLTRFAVPVFVMISGALLLGREYELGDFLKRRLSRIIIPFLFWSLVYVAYMFYDEQVDYSGDWWLTTKQVLHFLKYESSYHLWYVYMLIGLYLFIPILNKFIRAATEKEVLYFLLVWFVVMMLDQPYLSRFKPQLDLRYFEGFIGYLVLGHYLANKDFKIRYLKSCMWILFFAALGLTALGTYLLFDHYNGISTLMYEPLSPPIVIISVSIFMVARLSKPKLPGFMVNIRDFCGRYSYGMYLGHALVLTLLDQYAGLTFKLFTPIFSIPVTALICFMLTSLLVYLVNKIPVIGKWISG